MIAARHRRAGAPLSGGAVLLCAVLAQAPGAWAVGTAAGVVIENTATLSFQVGGQPGPVTRSDTARIFVDELLDVSVVNEDGGPVAVASPQPGAVTRFLLSNTGNGVEAFRLRVRDALSGDDFDPAFASIYLEDNGIDGLQLGPGGDLTYTLGANDPVLVSDAAIAVYVLCDLPPGLAENAVGRVTLEAVAATVFALAGTDDPTAAAWPAVGTSWTGGGDSASAGGVQVTAVVGTSHDPANLLLRDEARYRVSSAVVNLVKTATSVVDPDGGAEIVPGAVITYELALEVTGAGTASAVRIEDPLPADLQYVPGSLAVSLLPGGEEADDDFQPAGVDNTGFDAGGNRVTVSLGEVPGGSTPVTIRFEATIR